MSISKKTRFEVFKRDGFQCCYCGKTPPEVILEIDHIEPKSKKGSDDMVNLLTACFDCNRGKRDIPLDKIPSKLSENLEVLKLKEEQLIEYRKYVNKIEKRIQKDINTINEVYMQNFPGYEFSENFKQNSLKFFLKFLPVHKIVEYLRMAINKKKMRGDAVTMYFCGICWRNIKGTNLYPND